MTTITFDKPGNHIVLPLNGKRALVDTGAQVTLAEEPFEFLGERHNPPRELAGLTVARLSELAGFPIDILLGTDVLSRHDVLFGWHQSEAVFGPHLTVAGTAQPMATVAGVPLFAGHVNGRACAAIFDTGAPLGYVTEELVAGLTPVRKQRDFHPFIGAFWTWVYRLPTTVAGKTVELDYGVATQPELAGMMRAAGAQAIIGGGLLERFDCLVSWQRQAITWVEHTSTWRPVSHQEPCPSSQR